MTARRVVRSAAVLTVLAVLSVGCGAGDPEVVPHSCAGDPQVIVRALEAAPDPVTLPEGAPLSDCVRVPQSTADLQTVGVTLSGAAEQLERPALEGDEDAALRLGYLVGAAMRGAKRSNVAAQLVQRLERSAAAVAADGSADAALQRGLQAGEARG